MTTFVPTGPNHPAIRGGPARRPDDCGGSDRGNRQDPRISLHGCANFRDLGGYTTPQGRAVRPQQLFRSDSLHFLTPEDARIIRLHLGVATQIDLRTVGEVDRHGVGLLTSLGVRHWHLPLATTLGTLGAQEHDPAARGKRYLRIAHAASEQIARILRILADPLALPAVFFCAAGRDRTGILAAVVLGTLGVRHEDIVRDYAESTQYMETVLTRLRCDLRYAVALGGLPPEAVRADPHTMEIFLASLIEDYGSVRGFATWAGVEPQTVTRLETILLGPAPS